MIFFDNYNQVKPYEKKHYNITDWAPSRYMGINILPAITQIMLTEEREAHPVHTLQWCNGELGIDRKFIPYPAPDDQTMNA